MTAFLTGFFLIAPASIFAINTAHTVTVVIIAYTASDPSTSFVTATTATAITAHLLCFYLMC